MGFSNRLTHNLCRCCVFGFLLHVKIDTMKILFYDVETTGLEPGKHSIHQISGLIEIDGAHIESFDIRMRPHPKARIEVEALKVAGLTEADIMINPYSQKEGHVFLKKIIAKHVNIYDPKDKMFIVGFNNRSFDDHFLFKWFLLQGDNFVGSLFWFGLDTMPMALAALMPRRHLLPSFKLKRVALELGIEVDNDRLHDSLYDAELTRKIYNTLT